MTWRGAILALGLLTSAAEAQNRRPTAPNDCTRYHSSPSLPAMREMRLYITAEILEGTRIALIPFENRAQRMEFVFSASDNDAIYVGVFDFLGDDGVPTRGITLYDHQSSLFTSDSGALGRITGVNAEGELIEIRGALLPDNVSLSDFTRPGSIRPVSCVRSPSEPFLLPIVDVLRENVAVEMLSDLFPDNAPAPEISRSDLAEILTPGGAPPPPRPSADGSISTLLADDTSDGETLTLTEILTEAAPPPESGGLGDLMAELETDAAPAEVPTPTPSKPEVSTSTVEDTVATPASLRGLANLCHASDFVPVPVAAEDFTQPVGLFGRLRSGHVIAYEAVPFTSDYAPADQVFRVKDDSIEMLVPLLLPLGTRQRDALNGEILTPSQINLDLLSAPEELADDVAPETPAPYAEPSMRYLVVGDAPSILVSGLSTKVGNVIAKDYPTRPWGIDWLRFESDGSHTVGRDFQTFEELEMVATKGDKFIANNERKFEELLNAIENTLISADVTYDQVIWVLEGHTLPHTAPLRFQDFINRIGKSGNIARFPDRKPRKWLQVVTGEYNVSFGRAYLEGPLKTTVAGYLSEEEIGPDGRTVLLTDPSRLIDATRNILLRRHSGAVVTPTDPPEEAPSEKSLVFDAGAIFSEYGLVLKRETFQDFAKGTRKTINAKSRFQADQKANFDTPFWDVTRFLAPSTGKDSTFVVKNATPRQLSRRLTLLESQFGKEQLDAHLERLSNISEQALVPEIQNACDLLFIPTGQ